MSVTRWQKHSITDLQIGRIHTLQAAAPRIPRALQGCRRRCATFLSGRHSGFHSLHAHATPRAAPWLGKIAPCQRRHALTSRVPTCREHTLDPAGRGVNFLSAVMSLRRKAYVVAMHRQVARSPFPKSPQPSPTRLVCIGISPKGLSSSFPRQIANCLSVWPCLPARCRTQELTRPLSSAV